MKIILNDGIIGMIKFEELNTTIYTEEDKVKAQEMYNQLNTCSTHSRFDDNPTLRETICFLILKIVQLENRIEEVESK